MTKVLKIFGPRPGAGKKSVIESHITWVFFNVLSMTCKLSFMKKLFFEPLKKHCTSLKIIIV